MLQPGSTLGKYRIINKLGAGGMADVFLAEDTTLGRQVALKVLPPELARDPERIARFEKEVRASAALHHPNIVTLFEVGHEGGSPFYTMALLPGGDLKARILAGLTPEESLEIVKSLADALGYAHQQGFVHRDIKPENILFDGQGRPVLTDLGIARALGSGTRMTKVGMSIGTPHYMSPEQARGKEVDGRADLYSLGVVMYEMLTGRVPFDAEDTYAVGLMHISEPAPALPANLAALQPLLDRLLAKDPDGRFADAGELMTAIGQLQAGQPLERTVQKTQVMQQPVDKQGQVLTQVSQSSSTSPGSTSGLKWALGGGLLAVLVFGGLWLAQQNPKPAFLDSSSVAASTVGTVTHGAENGAVTNPEKEESLEPVELYEEGSVQQQIERLLAEAKRDMQSQRLTSPAGNNALERYRKILVLAPSNSQARDGLATIVSHYLSLCDEAIGEAKFAKAKDYLNKVAAIVPDAPGLAEARQRLLVAERERQRQAPAELETRKGPVRGRLWTDSTTGMEFVWVPGGCYQMGCGPWQIACDKNEKPAHEVCVEGFWIGRTEVTQGQWEKIMGSNPSYFKKGGNYPVEQVSWDNAKDFIRKLRNQSGKGYRLPSEVEWEYAARSGGKEEKYAGGSNLDAVAWYDGNSGNTTHPVAQKRANGLGLYDMSGNVWEWCQDWYGKDYYASSPRSNPCGPSTGSYRVNRGGGWGYGDWSSRSSIRSISRPGLRYNSLGLRLVLPAGY